MAESRVITITSEAQFDGLLQSSNVVVVDFFATWCSPCKMVAPIFERLANQLARDNVITFVRVDVDALPTLARRCNIKVMPTFVLFRNGAAVDRVEGTNMAQLGGMVAGIVSHAGTSPGGVDGGSGSGSGGVSASGSSAEASTVAGPSWFGASLPRGYVDITNQVEMVRLELLNIDTTAAGGVRVLFDSGKPSGRAETAAGTPPADWVESDTDDQLMLFVPFQSQIKLHTLQGDAARPLLLKLYSNSPHNLGFDEAEDTQATQEIELKPSDWNAEGTASVALRFVKFQNVTSLVLFVVSADDGADKVRLDRIRLIGEAGEKREMGKLEKIGDEPGE